MITNSLGWKVTCLSMALGASVEGIDLSEQLTDAAEAALIDLLAEHLVLVFPGQVLTPERHVAFGTVFGDPLIHPFLESTPDHPAILKVAKEPEDTEVFGGEYWHADITFIDPPSSVSLLYAIDIPDDPCGDTLFANQFMAYDHLSVGMQHMLDGLEAVHVYPDKAETAATRAVHPVVRTHPVSGRKGLFVNPAFVDRFVDMTAEESRPLLTQLEAHQTRPEFQGRVTWQPDQLTIWDNRAVMHYAINDYPGRRRVLQRVTVMERASAPRRQYDGHARDSST